MTPAVFLFSCAALAASFQAGFSRIDIGSGGWAQALAIADSKNYPVVIVTTNVGALTRSITDPASAQLASDYNLERSQILFNSSHVGPGEIPDHPAFIHDLWTVAAAALGNLAPAQVNYGSGRLRAGETTLDVTGCANSPESITLTPVGGKPSDCRQTASFQAVRTIDGQIRTAFEMTQLDFLPRTRETFERHLAYPVQAIRFGSVLTIVALGGEVSADYAARVRREYPGDLILVGSSNDVAARIPTSRELSEANSDFGLPGPFSDDVEDRVFAAMRRVLDRVGYKLPPAARR